MRCESPCFMALSDLGGCQNSMDICMPDTVCHNSFKYLDTATCGSDLVPTTGYTYREFVYSTTLALGCPSAFSGGGMCTGDLIGIPRSKAMRLNARVCTTTMTTMTTTSSTTS